MSYHAMKEAFSTEEWNSEPQTHEDAVSHPAHYCRGGIECIQAIKASMSPEAYRGYLKGNTLKYLWRYDAKAKPHEDLAKAAVYLGWLLEEVAE